MRGRKISEKKTLLIKRVSPPKFIPKRLFSHPLFVVTVVSKKLIALPQMNDQVKMVGAPTRLPG
jgi:hypothetical protein